MYKHRWSVVKEWGKILPCHHSMKASKGESEEQENHIRECKHSAFIFVSIFVTWKI